MSIEICLNHLIQSKTTLKIILIYLILVSVCISEQMHEKIACSGIERRNFTIRTELFVCIGTNCTLVCSFGEVIKWQCGTSIYFWRQDETTVRNNAVFPDGSNVSSLGILADKDIQCACTYSVAGQYRKHHFSVHTKLTQDNQADGSSINHTKISNANNQTNDQSYNTEPAVLNAELIGIVLTVIPAVILIVILIQFRSLIYRRCCCSGGLISTEQEEKEKAHLEDPYLISQSLL